MSRLEQLDETYRHHHETRRSPDFVFGDIGDGFDRIDTNAYETDSFVQCAVAAKNVSAAGTYHVTWTPDPDQGAQLWLVAVQ
jgi:hypothetical protein